MDRYSIIRGGEDIRPKKVEAPPVEVFGFDEPTVAKRGSAFEYLRLMSHKRYKVSIIPVTEQKFFKRALVHYDPGIRSYIRCQSLDCCKLGRPAYRYGAVVAAYADRSLSLRDFEVQPERFTNNFTLYAWTFSQTTYRRLNELNSVRPILSMDLYLQISFANGDPYRPIDLTPCANVGWSENKSKEEVDVVIREAKFIFEQIEVGENLTPSDMKRYASFKTVPRRSGNVIVGQGYAAATAPTDRSRIDPVMSWMQSRLRSRSETDPEETEPDDSAENLDQLLADL